VILGEPGSEDLAAYLDDFVATGISVLRPPARNGEP
jgi:hypothetical protein